MSAMLATLWGRPAEPTVRLQLPIGTGPSVSFGGNTFTADTDGHIDVPASAALEFRAHFPQAADPVGGSGAALREEIRLIDDQLKEQHAELAKLDAAARRAPELRAASAGSAAAVEELATIETKRRGVVTDWLLGLAKRAAVDEVDAQHKAAAAKAATKVAQDQKSTELVAVGIAEIQTRRGQVDRQIAELRVRRDLAVRRSIRAEAESAARHYWAAAGELGNRLAYLHAHALLLADLERIGSPRENTHGGAQSFSAPYISGRIEGLPAYPGLAAFAGVHNHQASCPFDLAAARERLRQHLTEQGLLA